LTDHAYDGIQEYDNPTPGWWTWIFIGTIVFSAVYFMIVTVLGRGQLSPQAGYDRAYVADLRKQFAKFGELSPDAGTILRLSGEPDALKVGESIFLTNCVSCHARDGSGLSGPNLTDHEYINVAKVEDILDVINKGRNNAAMPAWENRLSKSEVIVVSSYVASLRGKNLPGRPAEGKPAPPWGE
jgi:cytochrome c oxidase cbb3-type subunit 3